MHPANLRTDAQGKETKRKSNPHHTKQNRPNKKERQDKKNRQEKTPRNNNTNQQQNLNSRESWIQLHSYMSVRRLGASEGCRRPSSQPCAKLRAHVPACIAAGGISTSALWYDGRRGPGRAVKGQWEGKWYQVGGNKYHSKGIQQG